MKFIKRWIAKIVDDSLTLSNKQYEEASTQKLTDILTSSGAALLVFQIENGYLIRSASPLLGRGDNFVFCADHKALADHLVSTAVQQKLFGDRIAINSGMNPSPYIASQAYPNP
jgi:hypothetical protein